MDLIVVSGTSKGLGEAIAKQASSRNAVILGISRTVNSYLQEYFKGKQATYFHLALDLTDFDAVDVIMQKIKDLLDTESFTRIALINNAAVLEPVKALHEANKDELLAHLSVNLLSPMLLMSAFIKMFSHVQLEKIIFNITSGAAHNPYDGWSAYCTSKAGINMLTRVVAEEQFKSINPVKVVAFAPGVLDTDMQKIIRRTSVQDFGRKEKFVKLKEQNLLLNPDDVAQVILDNLFNPDIPQGAIIDVRDMGD